MPKTATTTSTSITTTTTTKVTLSPKLRKEILKQCQAWEVANYLANKGETDKKLATAAIDKVMSEAGEFRALEEGIAIDRFKAKMVFPIQTRWDDDKLRKYLTPAQMEECKTSKPGTGYVKVSVSKDKE